MNFSIEQAEISQLTDDLNKFSALVDQYSMGFTPENIFIYELHRFETVDWTKENMFNQMLSYYILASAYGALKNRKLDYTKTYYTNEYVYKEVSYYHNVQYIVSRVSKEEWAALYPAAFRISSKTYLCLANAYDHLGRFCEAQQYYKLAAMDICNTKDVEINQGYSYANMHTFWEHEEPWVVKHAQILFSKYSNEIDYKCPGLREKICSWPAPSFFPPKTDYMEIPEGKYEQWVNENYLRINRYCDVDVNSKLSLEDNVQIKHNLDTEERSELLESMYTQINNSFVHTRKKLYNVMFLQGKLDIELLKMIYKNFYSILDKIAMALSVYLELPIEPHKVDFANIWVDKSRKRIQTKILAHEANLSLLALYNIKQDIYGSSLIDYVIDEQTKDLKRIRNFLEHKFVRIQNGAMSYNDYQLTISKEEFTLNTIRLAQLVRCAIIYFCNFILHAEYDQKHPERNTK